MKGQAKEYYLDSPEMDAIMYNATFLQMYVDLIFEGEDTDQNGVITLDEFLESYRVAEANQQKPIVTETEHQKRDEL